jgi:hypothetical protein
MEYINFINKYKSKLLYLIVCNFEISDKFVYYVILNCYNKSISYFDYITILQKAEEKIRFNKIQYFKKLITYIGNSKMIKPLLYIYKKHESEDIIINMQNKINNIRSKKINKLLIPTKNIYNFMLILQNVLNLVREKSSFFFKLVNMTNTNHHKREIIIDYLEYLVNNLGLSFLHLMQVEIFTIQELYDMSIKDNDKLYSYVWNVSQTLIDSIEKYIKLCDVNMDCTTYVRCIAMKKPPVKYSYKLD